MAKNWQIDRLTIKGFKSIKDLQRLHLHRLNVLIGANGTGKSNFISYFRMLNAMTAQHLQVWTAKQGAADRIVCMGVKETARVESIIEFGVNAYQFVLEPTVDGGFVFAVEQAIFDLPNHAEKKTVDFGSGHRESLLKEKDGLFNFKEIVNYCFWSIAGWKVFHFHDTSDTAGVKRVGALQDDRFLRSDAANLAAYLYRISRESPETYEQIRRTVRLAVPFFDDFVLVPRDLETGERMIQLCWRQQGSDYVFHPSQFSDGSIRFICLATALLQPEAPSTIIIDEPELGLHPYAITLLGSLLKSAACRMQVIVSTQSVSLVNQFSLDDLIVVERENGGSVFRRYHEEDYKAWLDEYSTGELWEKNILGGRPRK